MTNAREVLRGIVNIAGTGSAIITGPTVFTEIVSVTTSEYALEMVLLGLFAGVVASAAVIVLTKMILDRLDG